MSSLTILIGTEIDTTLMKCVKSTGTASYVPFLVNLLFHTLDSLEYTLSHSKVSTLYSCTKSNKENPEIISRGML